MMRQRFTRTVQSVVAVCLISLFWLTGCATGPAPVPTLSPLNLTPEPTALPRTDQDILQLPAMFRYEVTLRPAGVKDDPATVITGQYRGGAWSQSTQRGQDAPEYLIIAPEGPAGSARSYTRPAGETVWTRWPGPGFDAGYGLASPFSVLRLYPLAEQRVTGEPDSVPGAPEATVKERVVVSADAVKRLLDAGASVVAANAEERAALETQLAPMVLSQTITYWVAPSRHIYQAAATLLTADTSGQPTPWLEAIWRFWAYDDPTITVAAPAQSTDAAALTPDEQPTTTAASEPALDPKTDLRVRAFALPGVAVESATVTVYQAGQRQPIGTQNAVDAQFALPPGTYDVLVQADKAEEWLKGVKIIAGSVVSQDVVFNFGKLTLIVVQNGATPKVDLVVYPAGQRQTFIDWRSENPTIIYLRAGKYDVEVALPDYTGIKAFDGIEVRSGQTVTQTLDISR